MYPATGLQTVAGYESLDDCVHDALGRLGVIHAKVKSF